MDPESNIKSQLALADRINDIRDNGTGALENDVVGLINAAYELAELVEALNAWLRQGGMYPAAWGTRCVNVAAHVKARP